MLMLKKDFNLIAKSLCIIKPKRIKRAEFLASKNWLADYKTWENCCIVIALALQDTNPRFDKNRFLAACGLE